MSSHRRPPQPVLVGLVDTPGGWAALDAGIRLARQEHVPLSLVHVWCDVDWLVSAGRSDIAKLVRGMEREQAFFAAACAHARSVDPEMKVDGEFAPGSLYGVLMERSGSARLLVLGTSSHGDGTGPVGTWYVEHARCPVVVIAPDGSIVAESQHANSTRMASHG